MRQVIQRGREDQGADALGDAGQQPLHRPANQLALAYEGDSEQLAPSSTSPPAIEEVFREAQRVFNEWSKLPAEERTTDAILPDARLRLLRAARRGDDRPLPQAHPGVLRHLRDRRVPQRLPPVSVRSPLTDLPGMPSFTELFEQLSSLTLAVYAPFSMNESLVEVSPSTVTQLNDWSATVFTHRSARPSAPKPSHRSRRSRAWSPCPGGSCRRPWRCR